MTEQVEALQRLAGEIGSALEGADLSAFSDLLDPDVHWGPPGDPSPPCTNRDEVLAWYHRGKEAGANARVAETSVLGDHILVGLIVSNNNVGTSKGKVAERWQILTVRVGRVANIAGFESRGEAVAFAETH